MIEDFKIFFPDFLILLKAFLSFNLIIDLEMLFLIIKGLTKFKLLPQGWIFLFQEDQFLIYDQFKYLNLFFR